MHNVHKRVEEVNIIENNLPKVFKTMRTREEGNKRTDQSSTQIVGPGGGPLIVSRTDTSLKGNAVRRIMAEPKPPKLQRFIPLTSFASTPQNVAAIAFLLGCVFGGSIPINFSIPPLLGVYAAAWSLFHLLEFIVTATWNPSRTSVDCTC